MNLSHFVRTDWFYRIVYRFCFVVLSTILQSAIKTQPVAVSMGYWLLVIGYRPEYAALSMSVPLHPMLYTTSDSDHAPNLITFNL